MTGHSQWGQNQNAQKETRRPERKREGQDRPEKKANSREDTEVYKKSAQKGGRKTYEPVKGPISKNSLQKKNGTSEIEKATYEGLRPGGSRLK